MSKELSKYQKKLYDKAIEYIESLDRKDLNFRVRYVCSIMCAEVQSNNDGKWCVIKTFI